MWVLYVLLAIVALIVTILSLPVQGRITYDGELYADLHLGGLRYSLIPEATETEMISDTRKRLKGKISSQWKEVQELLKQDDLEGTLYFFRGVVKMLAHAIGRFLRSITVTRFQLQMLIASGDPADTAQLYGQVCSVLYPALEMIGSYVRIRNRQLRVEPNFLLEQSKTCFDIRFRIALWRLLGVVFTFLFSLMKLREEDRQKEVS